MPELAASLPVFAVDGTLKTRVPALRGYAHLKGGTLTGVQSVAGYVLGRGGNALDRRDDREPSERAGGAGRDRRDGGMGGDTMNAMAVQCASGDFHHRGHRAHRGQNRCRSFEQLVPASRRSSRFGISSVPPLCALCPLW
jgi:hypothetical protein